MGKVIICNGKLAKTPYIVKETERKLYCIEEICHYVSTNIYSIDLDFFTPELIYYIKDELGLRAAADKLRSLIIGKYSLNDIITALFCSCDLYSKEEILEKIETGIFSKFKSTLPIYIEDCNKLKDFTILNNYAKSRFIQEILKCLNSQQGEFSTKYTHNYSKKYNMKLNKSKILENDFYIINQSPTGLFEKKVFLDK